MERTSENTLRVIESANRSLETHRKRFGATNEGSNFCCLNKVAPENRENVPDLKKSDGNSLDKRNPLIHKTSIAQECTRSADYIKGESLSISEKKVKELEDRISNILEYSSQLERTIKANLDSVSLSMNTTQTDSTKNYCCCNAMDESRIISIVKKTVNSISVRSSSPFEAKNLSRSKKNVSHFDLEKLADKILDACFEEVIESVDRALENISHKFIKTLV